MGEADMVPLEVCVDTLAGVGAARRGGAARIELCAALSEGGLTPSAGLMAQAVRAAGAQVEVYAMIRPRAGLFDYGAEEMEVMLADLAAARAAGVSGVVLGVQRADGALDTARLARLKAAAGLLGTTLHRVIDVVPDPLAALDAALGLGFDRVLTSGGANSAAQGAAELRALVARARGRIGIMAGGGVTPETLAVVLATGVDAVHASCAAPASGARTFADFDPAGGRRVTEECRVRALVAALEAARKSRNTEGAG
ncbi:copper homeostasis protein CutC [Oceanicola granulosus]|uniref:copper homeostasis protein CutC n=1 Tax=Oceanicola granulosus TaxID=252302 RepID=UPI0006819D3F|nr:copper homeostasis protein CutC [Oceanicola granulosus]